MRLVTILLALMLAVAVSPAQATGGTLTLRAAKKAARAQADRDVVEMRAEGLSASFYRGPVCKRLTPKAMRCGYRIQFISQGFLELADHHVLVTLSYGYAFARRVGPEHAYGEGLERIPPLRP